MIPMTHALDRPGVNMLPITEIKLFASQQDDDIYLICNYRES